MGTAMVVEVILAILLPPLGVFLRFGCDVQFWICLVLTLLGYLPGIIYALYVRGCRCRFLVRYDHDQSEEIVPLRKICRRPETDYRMQQLNMAKNMPTTATTEPQKFVVSNPNPGSTILKPPANHPNVAVQTYQKITVNPNSAGVPVSVQTSMGVSPVNVIPELQKVGSGNPMVSSEISGNKATIVSMGMPSEMAKQ